MQADARLLFTPMHKTLRVQLPDLQILDLRVNFSSNVFSTVIHICKDLGKISIHLILYLYHVQYGSRCPQLGVKLVTVGQHTMISIYHLREVEDGTS